MALNPVVIAGSLSKEELEKSIKEIVNAVDVGMDDVSKKFDTKLAAIEENFKKAGTKIGTAFKDSFNAALGGSFDQLAAAMEKVSNSASAGGGGAKGGKGATGGGSGTTYEDDTIGALKEEIKQRNEALNVEKLNTAELQQQVNLLTQKKDLLKQQTTSTEKQFDKYWSTRYKEITTLSDASLPKAEEKLRRLQDLQRDMRQTGFVDQAKLNRVEKSIDSLTAKIARLRQGKGTTNAQLSLKDVLGMDENSVENIAKKMQALKRVQIDPKNTLQIKQLGDEYQRLSRMQAEWLGKSIEQTHSNNALARSFGYIRNRIVYAVTIGALMNFTKQIFEIRGQYELLERSLGVLLNSFEHGTQVFQELNKMALESPFTLMELAGAAKQLTAYNFSANEVVDTTRRLADISAALGVPMERLTYNLGQIRAQTVLTARDARDFANAGLPIVKSLSDYYTELEGRIVSTGDVYDRMKKKMVSYGDVMAVLNKMTDEGGKFFEFQAKQAQTLRVQMANLTLAWNNMLNELGKANQGLLSMPIQGMKTLLQNWGELARMLKNVGNAFIFLRVAQMIAIRMQLEIAQTAGGAARMMGTMANAAKSVGVALKAAAVNPWTWIFTALFAITDFIGQLRAAHKETVELNEELKKGATEASQSNLDYLSNKGNVDAKKLATENKLTADQGAKAWESLEEQIRQSSSSANELLGELMSINDINERISTGFDYLERIQKAQAAIQDFGDTAIKVTHDIGWGGIFGEGLVSDLEDYGELLNKWRGIFAKNAADFEKIYAQITSWEGYYGDMDSEFDQRGEFFDELEKTAQSINNFIKVNKITDPLQIKEILERVKAQIKLQNPEIKGELANIFDVSLDQRLAVLTNNAVDQNASLWEIFLERLKHNSSSAFQDITSDIYTESGKLTKQQQEAVDKNLEYFKNAMPWYYQAMQEMVADASKLRINIGVTFNIEKLTNLQKDVNERIKNAAKTLDFGSESLLPTQNDNFKSWVESRQNDIASLKASNDLLAKDNKGYTADEIAANNKLIQQNKNLLDLYDQQYEKEKKSKSSSSKKDILGDALTKELQLITDIQKLYKEYTKAGVDSETAKNAAAKEYQETLEQTNATLSKFGVQGLTGEKLATMDLRAMRDYYQSILDKVQSSPKAVEALEKAIRNLNVEITKEGQKTIIDSLNSELSKLKDEYELAVELDANPELGGVFADMMGLSKEELEKLPRDFEGVVRKLQSVVDKELGMGAFDVRSNLNKDVFDQWIKANKYSQDSDIVAKLKALTEYANKVRLDETKKQIEDWNKLLEKYAEYEYKRTQITQEAERERETARKKGAPSHVMTAIDMKEAKDLAKVNIEEFQQSSEWITATGDLVGLTDEALGLLIRRIEEFKKSQKYLDAKQIKQLNNALKQLYQQQRKGNPFLQLSNAIQENKMRREEWSKELEEDSNIIEEQNKKIEEGTHLTEEETKTRLKLIDRIKELKEGLATLKDVTPEQVVDYLTTIHGVASQAAGSVSDMMKAFGNTEDAEKINKVMSTIEKGLQFAQMGAAIGGKSAGGWGAAIGGVIGLLVGGLTAFADEISGNADITKEIQKSELAVKRLSNAYEELSWQVDKAYGVAVSGLQHTTIENKKLQLAEAERQLELEKSRSKKRYDEERVIELQGQVESLKREIKDSTSEIVNDTLGISSAADEITNLVQVMIDAFRNGEDAMEAFGKEWDKMIDNMILKLIVSEYMKRSWDNIMKTIEDKQEEFLREGTKAREDANAEIERLRTQNGYDLAKEYVLQHIRETGDMYGLDAFLFVRNDYNRDELARAAGFSSAEALRQYLIEQQQGIMAGASAQLERASQDYTEWTLDYMMHEGRDMMMSAAEGLKQGIDEYYDFGELAEEQKLSNLQQGIQSLSEDTGNAIESYLNGISQQIYLHSSQLEEIKALMQGWDFDVSLGTMSQVLLQLQSSYQVQMTIQNTLLGWSSPNGMSVRVEMV